MKDFPVALQLYSVREDMEADFAGTLQKVKEIGYDGVEFAGLFGHDTPFAYFQTKPGTVMQARHKKKSFLYWIKLPGLEIASFFVCVNII